MKDHDLWFFVCTRVSIVQFNSIRKNFELNFLYCVCKIVQNPNHSFHDFYQFWQLYRMVSLVFNIWLDDNQGDSHLRIEQIQYFFFNVSLIVNMCRTLRDNSNSWTHNFAEHFFTGPFHCRRFLSRKFDVTWFEPNDRIPILNDRCSTFSGKRQLVNPITQNKFHYSLRISGQMRVAQNVCIILRLLTSSSSSPSSSLGLQTIGDLWFIHPVHDSTPVDGNQAAQCVQRWNLFLFFYLKRFETVIEHAAHAPAARLPMCMFMYVVYFEEVVQSLTMRLNMLLILQFV